MTGPFRGHGIDIHGNIRHCPLSTDPYVQLLLSQLDDPELYRGTPESSRARQQRLLRPFLEFFLRHDRDGFYRGLFLRKGILVESSAGAVLREGLVLEDLAKLRIHSDDLRGKGQKRRVIRDIYPDTPPQGSQVHLSSGTTGVAGGPVQILRSPLTILLMRRVNGGLITWSLGRSSTGGLCMLQMAPEMTDSVTFASFAADVLHELDSEIVFGNSLRPAGNDENIWRRLEPDMHTMRSFFASKVEPKLLVTGSAGLFATVANPSVVRRLAIKLVLGVPPVELGEGGVLMTGGGLKRVPAQYSSMRELVSAIAHTVTCTHGGRKARAPIIDFLGLTESASVFVNQAADPLDETAWIKYPHPLTFVSLLDSPGNLSPVSPEEFGKPRLLFFMNFTCLDYLEAIVSGDFVTRVRTPSFYQHGFLYERRADASEGFQAREGCG